MPGFGPLDDVLEQGCKSKLECATLEAVEVSIVTALAMAVALLAANGFRTIVEKRLEQVYAEGEEVTPFSSYFGIFLASCFSGCIFLLIAWSLASARNYIELGSSTIFFSDLFKIGLPDQLPVALLAALSR